MSVNPPPVDPVLSQAQEALNILEARRARWQKVNAAFLTGREALDQNRQKVALQLYGEAGPSGSWQALKDNARHILTLGRSHRTSLDGLIDDLREVQSALKDTLPSSVRKTALAYGLPADPAALYRKRLELQDSLTDFSARLTLDPATRGSRKMTKYLDALEAGNYGRALKLADKDPPIWMRVFVPWKAQAMRNDNAALKAGVDSYRRTKETVKVVEKLSDKIESATANALLKVAHSDAWKRLRALPDLETKLAACPELAILMKYDPQAATNGAVSRNVPLVLRMKGGHPSKADLMADLMTVRVDALASGRPATTPADMARVVESLATGVEAARTELKALHKDLGGRIKDYDRALRATARLEARETTARVARSGRARVSLDAQVASVVGAKSHFDQVRRDLGQASMEGSPETRRKARETLDALKDPASELARVFAAVEKASVSPKIHEKIEAAAQSAERGESLPKGTPGVSTLRAAFAVAAPGLERTTDAVVVRLGEIWNAIKAAGTRTEAVRKERIEPVFG
ncbi:MAG TPA: hypothetical protein PKX87_01120 [Alphaproteobacteria bacterium]|nr:hypothetical protein [Alphaproteobacteria bacterium]